MHEYAAPTELPPLAQLPGVELAITDYLMMGENGMSFARRFHESHPSVPVILVTAYSAAHVPKEAAASAFVSLLHKPVDYEQLHRLVEDIGCHRG